MNRNTRREFIHQAGLTTMALGLALGRGSITSAATAKRKMTIDLVCGNLGVSASQTEAVELAARHGFESVGADSGYLASITDDQVAELKSLLESKGLLFGASGLPLEFRRDDERFRESLKTLPKFAAGLKRAGVDRVGTWLTPCDDHLTYLQNFRQHAVRLREAGKVLQEQGLRLGLEYVGPKTSWASRRYPFIHTMAEMKDLIAEINAGNVGFILDSWHWWNAGETAADVLSLKSSQVIAVDLNDAPAGIPKDQQNDGRRELPCATGVIDVGAFLNALNQIGYDGPVRAEPFNQAVRQMTKEDACEAASVSLKKAFALITP
jgi:sugar phosphate isomerase/epimerase